MDDVHETLKRGWLWHQAGSLRSAEEIYEQLIAQHPALTEARYGLALVRHDQGRFTEAIDLLAECVRNDGSKAAYHAGLAEAYKAMGRTDEAVASYQRAVELRPQFAAAHNNLGNLYRQLGRREDAVACYRRALESNPQLADAHNNLGTIYSELGRAEEAVVCFRGAVAAHPAGVAGHANLGLALAGLGRYDEAIAAYQEALARDPNAPALYYRLGTVYAQNQRMREAMEAFEHAIRIDGGFALAHHGLARVCQSVGQIERARAYFQRASALDARLIDAAVDLGHLEQSLGNSEAAEQALQHALAVDPKHWRARLALGQEFDRQGRVVEALGCYEAVLATEPDLPQAHLNRALSWLQQGNFAAGWQEYEWRWKCPWTKPHPFEQPLWDGRDLAGRTILVHAEQGLGDTLQFIRFLPLVRARGGQIVLHAPPPLLPLLSLADLPAKLVAWGEPSPECDVRIPLLSLPALFDTRLETIPGGVPYLRADPRLVEHWRPILARLEGIKLGVNWHGKTGTLDADARTLPAAEFAALAELERVHLINLQKGPAGAPPPFKLLNLSDDFDQTAGPFMDTAAVMMGLDLVITSDTAVAHLAGALGVPVWVVLSVGGNWRWLTDREDTPWYPSMRLFRQSRLQDWSVFRRVAAELANLKPRPQD